MAGANWLAFGNLSIALGELAGFGSGLGVIEGLLVGNASPGGAAMALAGGLLNQMELDVGPPGTGFFAAGARPKLWGPGQRAVYLFVTKYVGAPPEVLAADAGPAAGSPEAAAFRARFPAKADLPRSIATWNPARLPVAVLLARAKVRNLDRKRRIDFRALHADVRRARDVKERAAKARAKAKAKPAPP